MVGRYEREVPSRVYAPRKESLTLGFSAKLPDKLLRQHDRRHGSLHRRARLCAGHSEFMATKGETKGDKRRALTGNSKRTYHEHVIRWPAMEGRMQQQLMFTLDQNPKG